MAIADAVTAIEAQLESLLPDYIMYKSPDEGRSGRLPYVTVYRNGFTESRLNRVHNVLITIGKERSPYIRGEEIDELHDMAYSFLDWLVTQEPGDMKLYWEAGVTVDSTVGDGTIEFQISVPLVADYHRIR